MSVSRRTFLKAGIGAGLAASQLDRSGFASAGKREPVESKLIEQENLDLAYPGASWVGRGRCSPL